PGAMTDWLSEVAAENGVHLVAGILERDSDSVYSTAVLIGNTGNLITTYRRMAIYDLESYFLTPGSQYSWIDTQIGRIGLVVGYDIQFPEVLRALFAAGVEILVCPSLLLRPFADSIRQMILARAAENCCFILYCSATGENTLAGLTYMGGSVVAQSPVGVRAYSNEFRRQPSTLAELDRDEDLVVADLALGDLRRLHAANPLVKDFRRSHLCEVLINAHPGALHGTEESSSNCARAVPLA
ncbi:MAG: carbon-nitrogen hydrolase family protein, partial [Pseudonocardiaceae bacterium]